jgi:hypothetical protein
MAMPVATPNADRFPPCRSAWNSRLEMRIVRACAVESDDTRYTVVSILARGATLAGVAVAAGAVLMVVLRTVAIPVAACGSDSVSFIGLASSVSVAVDGDVGIAVVNAIDLGFTDWYSLCGIVVVLCCCGVVLCVVCAMVNNKSEALPSNHAPQVR